MNEQSWFEIRKIEGTDAPQLARFFQGIAEADRNFFKEDVLDSHLISSWTTDEVNHRLVATTKGNDIVGYAATLAMGGWESHVGELRLVVAPDQRGKGLGGTLAKAAVDAGVKKGLKKVFVEVLAPQTPVKRVFESMGFVPEALFRSQVIDRSGAFQDLIVLSYFADEKM